MIPARGAALTLAAWFAMAVPRAQTQPSTSGAKLPRVSLHRTRHLPSDLQIGGALASISPGETRFIAYADLLKHPQQSYMVSDDSNFIGTVRISGVALDKLPTLLGAAPGATMVTAICDDFYAAHYPADYMRAHHPLLVLRINGRDPAHWPLGSDHVPMGPYLISHAKFTPGFRVLSHTDEPQVPWGVVRLDFRREFDVYAPILPLGPHANDASVQQGYAIARQNCFRCHDHAGQGGEKSHRPWDVVARRAVTDPQYFNTYVRHPRALNPASQMAASPQYDDATLAALRAYFQPFAETRP